MSDPLAEDRLADLLLAWEEHFERGEDVAADELCADRPDLIPRLAARIDLLRTVAWVNRPPPSDSERGVPFLPPTEPLAGRYRLDALIGQGGYGQVWKGYDLELHRPVAVKLPQPGCGGGRPGGEDRILAEARKVARLAHPGIVPVYDVGRHGAGYFIVSELIDGDDLARRLRGDGLPVREAVRVVAEAARHVHYAHTQGFVHRDIKPANLLLDRLGRVLVTDFGIAVPTDGTGAADGAGTLAYMAPEQLYPDPVRVDPRTDVYALGVVLYRAATGTLPFPATAPAILRHQILHTEPPPPRSVSRAVPTEIERICLRCLAKSPANRYPTAEALADDLARWLRRGCVGRLIGWVTQPFFTSAVREPVPPPVEGGRAEGSPSTPVEDTTRGAGRTRPSRRRELLLAFGGLFGAAVLIGMWLVFGRGLARSEPTAEITQHEPPAGGVQPAVPKPHEEAELFNGRTLEGWSFHTSAKGYAPDDAIRIESGLLALRGVDQPGKAKRLPYRITTTRRYADFVLTLEYRLPVGGAKTAAGGCLLLRVQNPDRLAQANLRVKLGPSATAGQLLLPGADPDYDAIAPPVARPDGEWNSLEVRCAGPAVVAVLNGRKTGEVRADEGEGFIGLTTQGSDMDFRNLRVRVHKP